MEDYKQKIHRLPGTRTAPATVLGHTLDMREHIKAVVVGILWKDGTVDFDWSNLTLENIVYIERRLKLQVDGILRGDDPKLRFGEPSDPPDGAA
jgi:hypothetical protein